MAYKFATYISISAPSAAPTSVRESGVTSSNITVQWGAVDCIHHNGDITGYSVRYGVQGSGSTQTRDVSGGGVTEATISSLMPSTTYSIQVAAVNSVGIGDYSNTVNQLTSRMYITSSLCTHYCIHSPFTVVAPVLSVTSTAPTSLSLSWTSAGTEVEYEVTWQRDTLVGCTNMGGGSMTITDGSTTTYEIMELEEDSSYSLTVTATNAVDSAVSNQATGMTSEDGKSFQVR